VHKRQSLPVKVVSTPSRVYSRKTAYKRRYATATESNIRRETDYTVSQKTVHNCLCQNFVKFPPILIIFGRLKPLGHSIHAIVLQLARVKWLGPDFIYNPLIGFSDFRWEARPSVLGVETP